MLAAFSKVNKNHTKKLYNTFKIKRTWPRRDLLTRTNIDAESRPNQVNSIHLVCPEAIWSIMRFEKKTRTHSCC
jgi:hypothetical protein